MTALIRSYFDGDRINPIVIKEVRQAVAGKFVSSVLLFFLFVQLCVLFYSLFMAGTGASNFQAGRDAFMTLHIILLGTCLLFVPLYAGWRVSSERADANVDLLYITTISPRKIVAGKFLSAMVVALLVYSSCLPFLAMTYLLRGIDLPTILIILGMDLCVVALSTMLVIWIGCIPAALVVRIILFIMALGMLIWAFIATAVGSYALLMFGAGSAIGSGEFWLGAAGFLIPMVCLGGLFFVVSVAMISPPTSNRAFAPRLYITLIWAITAAVAAVVDLQGSNDTAFTIWLWNWHWILDITLLVAISEREQWTPRLLLTMPKAPLSRRLAFFFYSGAANGVLWTLALMTATIAGAWIYHRDWRSATYRDVSQSLEVLTPLTFYWIAYCLTGLLIRRHMLSTWVRSGATFGVALVLMAVGTIVPIILVLLISPSTFNNGDEPGLAFITVPFMVLGNRNSHVAAWIFSGAWCLLATLCCMPWIMERFNAFRRPAPAPPPPPEPDPVLLEPADTAVAE